MQIFELKSIKRSGNKQPDGSYEVFERELGVFDDLGKAETFMRMFIDKEKNDKYSCYSEYHCFVIYEKTLNPELSKTGENICEFEGIRSYLPDGTLYCDSPYDDACEKPFCGRPAETIKLKVGDIAWFLWFGHHIYPCLVAVLPPTDVRYQQKVEDLGHEMRLDYSDDSYKVYTCDRGHFHPECWRCMPYYGKISQRTLQRLYACKRREEAENEQWRKEQKRVKTENNRSIKK